jgi:hypothetical protein
LLLVLLLLLFLRSTEYYLHEASTQLSLCPSLLLIPISFCIDTSYHPGRLSAADRAEYDTLETTARAYYQALKDREKGPISRHFLALTQKLMPLRIACAGGRVPLDDVPIETEEEDEEGNNDDEDDEDEDAPKKKKPKKFSKFAFTSKLKTLVSELERLRIDDPTGTCRVCCLASGVTNTSIELVLHLSRLVLFIFSQKSRVLSIQFDAAVVERRATELRLSIPHVVG